MAGGLAQFQQRQALAHRHDIVMSDRIGLGLLARPERPSRWTLPITALRVTFPSSAAIWLAESPASQSFFSCSTRSSDQVNTVIALFPSSRTGQFLRGAAMPNLKKSLRPESLSPRRAQKARPDVYAEQLELRGSRLPHEMSYSTVRTLQYGVTPAQESCRAVHMFRPPFIVAILPLNP